MTSVVEPICKDCLAYLPAPIPGNEEERLEVLRSLQVLDTPPEERFDNIVKLAARVFDVPIAYISLVDFDRQFFKAKTGMNDTGSPRSISFCGHAILQADLFVIDDLTKDERFAGNPMVVGEPYARFYAGMPLTFREGINVGTLCLLDREPRSLDKRQRQIMRDLSKLVLRELQLAEFIKLQEETLRVRQELIDSQTKLVEEKRKTDELLLNILPREVAEELKANGEVGARLCPGANVMFTDFTNFTRVSTSMSPEELLRELNVCFVEFDHISERHGVEKLKTIGDAYLCVSGLDENEPGAAERLLECAKEIRDFVRQRQNAKLASGMDYWGIRIGLHTGPLVAGVVGRRKFAFDVWGDTVNTAARYESTSDPGKINVSREFLDKLPNGYQVVNRGPISIKGKGEIEMFFVE